MVGFCVDYELNIENNFKQLRFMIDGKTDLFYLSFLSFMENSFSFFYL